MSGDRLIIDGVDVTGEATDLGVATDMEVATTPPTVTTTLTLTNPTDALVDLLRLSQGSTAPVVLGPYGTGRLVVPDHGPVVFEGLVSLEVQDYQPSAWLVDGWREALDRDGRPEQ